MRFDHQEEQMNKHHWQLSFSKFLFIHTVKYLLLIIKLQRMKDIFFIHYFLLQHLKYKIMISEWDISQQGTPFPYGIIENSNCMCGL